MLSYKGDSKIAERVCDFCAVSILNEKHKDHTNKKGKISSYVSSIHHINLSISHIYPSIHNIYPSIYISCISIYLCIMLIDLSIYLSMCSSINLHTVYSPISFFWLFIGNKTKHYYHITVIHSTIESKKSHNFQLSQLPLNSPHITHIGSNSKIHWKNTPTTHGSIAGIIPYYGNV